MPEILSKLIKKVRIAIDERSYRKFVQRRKKEDSRSCEYCIHYGYPLCFRDYKKMKADDYPWNTYYVGRRYDAIDERYSSAIFGHHCGKSGVFFSPRSENEIKDIKREYANAYSDAYGVSE